MEVGQSLPFVSKGTHTYADADPLSFLSGGMEKEGRDVGRRTRVHKRAYFVSRTEGPGSDAHGGGERRGLGLDETLLDPSSRQRKTAALYVQVLNCIQTAFP